MMIETKQGTYFRGEDSYLFEFCTDLTTSKKLKLINTVSSILVDGENYNSVARDLIFDFYLIETMTDIDLTDLGNSVQFVDEVEQFLEETNIADIVKANAVFGLITELNKAIDYNIEYKTGIHPNPLNDTLSNILSILEDKLKDFDMDEVIELANRFNGMAGEFTPENVVKAYLETDIHKENLKEIADK